MAERTAKRSMRWPVALLSLSPILAILAACDGAAESAPSAAADVVRIPLDETGIREATAMASPDTQNGVWMVAESGQAINFGNVGEGPLLTLACNLGELPSEFVIIRHAEALPGQSALFPIIGNGMRSRFLADTALATGENGGEWLWEARLPANDPQLDVFAGTRDLTATLPGRGMLEIRGSRIPGEFLEWCRAGGETPNAQPAEPAVEDEDS